MTTPIDRIQSDVKAAMKARESERLATLRMLLAEMKNVKIELGRDLDDDAFVAVVRRAVKQRKDSVEQYRQGGREDLASREEREIVILDAYLPQQAGEDEVRAAIRDFVASAGLAGPKAIGQVMKAMLAHFGARCDGATINRLAREVLSP